MKKLIPDFPDYFVTNDGRVWNESRGRYLKPTLNKDGYLHLNLQKDGKRTLMLVHRLVALAFVPTENTSLVINHKDMQKTNNVHYNLEWVTRAENNAEARATAITLKSPSGEHVEVFNITQFCKDNGLNRGNMSSMIRGARKHAHGWTKV